MKFAAYSRGLCRYLGCSVALLSTVFNLVLPPGPCRPNRSQLDPNQWSKLRFSHVYATYKPQNGEKVFNLLSEEIIKANGERGPNYSLSAQFSAVDM